VRISTRLIIQPTTDLHHVTPLEGTPSSFLFLEISSKKKKG
jgi:hypothetical protein